MRIAAVRKGRTTDLNSGEYEIVNAIIDGELHALWVAYRLHASGVFGVAFRVTVDTHYAEDVTQEVFAALWREDRKSVV